MKIVKILACMALLTYVLGSMSYLHLVIPEFLLFGITSGLLLIAAGIKGIFTKKMDKQPILIAILCLIICVMLHQNT
jgi:hypothetical protein